MPQNNYDPAPIPGNSGERGCPKCGAEMEPIDIGVEGLALEQLQLCPGCYLVTWSDQDGLHARQGVPVKPGVDQRLQPRTLVGEPEEC